MTHTASTILRRVFLASLLSVGTLAGVASASPQTGTGNAPASMSTATKPADPGSFQLAQWGPRQCCRRVGGTYQCGPC